MIERVPLIGVQGNVKIETFDALTGKKKAETEGHNLFTNYGLGRFRKYCALAIGGQFGKNIYFDENISDETYSTTSNSEWGFLRYLILTDNASAISASDSVIPGT